ncbi:phosphoribosylglycinamide synthetase [Erythrobacter sp.]|jgi:D-alanine-D-alanine ligase|uniref:phosphoribosylglycinamide synthetase n=1 Tax=Erythrobacter sp. TaxID=1042 RepID=UPI002EC48098|nr:phosphoribosylglycinamide synthetase [Erythrobacter sp.]
MHDSSPNFLSPRTIPQTAKDRLRVLFIAKNAGWTGDLHPQDGNHAIYHRETRETLEAIGLDLMVAQTPEILFDPPGDIDFVFPLLNRAGYFNSEMLVPLLCERAGLAYLGASPILRGLADDKHLAKRAAAAAGAPTAPWAVFRKGAPLDLDALPPAERYVVKPNNSSASWGVRDASSREEVAAAVREIHEDSANGGQDAIVEPFLEGSDVEVPVVTIDGEPRILPLLIFRQSDPSHLRTYFEKRDLVERETKYSLEAFTDPEISRQIAALTAKVWGEYRPFDYGRFEFRVNEATGEMNFLELNLNCNLWSQKVFGRAARMAGWSHEQLIETILAEGLVRHGLL